MSKTTQAQIEEVIEKSLLDAAFKTKLLEVICAYEKAQLAPLTIDFPLVLDAPALKLLTEVKKDIEKFDSQIDDESGSAHRFLVATIQTKRLCVKDPKYDDA